MFCETFLCAFDHSSRRFIAKLATQTPTTKKSRKTVSSGRICSQLATAFCAYAEHLNASALHIVVPKGHREYAAWMRACLYVGLKLTSGSKSQKLLNGSGNVLLSLKITSSSVKDSVSTVGTDSTYEGWSPRHSDDVMSESGSDFYLDLNA